jgi:hypothetical protein
MFIACLFLVLETGSDYVTQIGLEFNPPASTALLNADITVVHYHILINPSV